MTGLTRARRTFNGAILLHVVTRRLSGTTTVLSTAGTVSLVFVPPNGTAWRSSTVDLTAVVNREYWVTTFPDGSTVFLPKQAGLPPQRATFTLAQGQLVMTPWQMLAPTDFTGLTGLLLSRACVAPGYALAVAASGWDWLQRVQFGGGYYVEGVFNSAPVSMTISVQGNCNELSCEGCPNVQVQRLCLSYNKCALVNCVGTPVHQRKPLCGVGALLRHNGQMSLSATNAAWSVFAEMVGLVLDLNLLTVHEAQVKWPEDSFLCHVCAAKGASAEFFSILTAILNSALQLGGANVGYLYGGATNVNRNADAVLTVSNTALNAFMHQVALAPLFLMIAAHQVMLCQTAGLLALIDSKSSFQIDLLPADQSTDSDAVAGQCLTLGAAVLAMYPTDDPKGLASVVASTMANSVQLLLIDEIEPVLHYMDTAIAYLIGLVQSFAALVVTQNMARCNPPDFSVAQVVRCACGDQPLGIQAARRKEGAGQFAHWCTGVLSMLDSNGQPMYVYNPYTYDQVQAMAAGMQAYLDCLGQGTAGYTCAPPSDPAFSGQGVNALNVLVACRENYAKRRWDPAAFVLYNRLPGYPLRYNGVVPVPARDTACYIRDCMQQQGAGVAGLAMTCLEQYLQCTGVSSDAYWQYEHAAGAGPEFVDACLVFYGPAQAGLAAFQACVDGPDEGNCTLPGHCWTPRSPNNVPVCDQHRVVSTGASRDGLVQRLYAEAQQAVLQAVQASRAYQLSGQSQASAAFFSEEGDVIHQTMDCIFLGPYSRVDYWPAPVCQPGEECLEGPFWARDEGGGATRAVDANACPSETTLPYTCGSLSRRAVMRYFVHDYLPQHVDGNNNSLLREVMLAYLDEIRGDWNDTSRYGCPCAAGGALPSCCVQGGPLLPPGLNKTFTSIPTKAVLGALAQDFKDIFARAVDDITPWRLYLDAIRPGASAAYDWRGSQRAEDEARLNPVAPSMNYTKDEAMTPVTYASNTLWDTCHAALKQLLFTLPLNDTGLQFDAPAFDGNASRIEEYVATFTSEAFLRSPLHRFYTPKHAPSHSHMCEAAPSQDASEGMTAWTDFVQGGAVLLDRRVSVLTPLASYRAQRFRVGEAGCLCGWRRSGGACLADPSACADVCRLARCERGCWFNASDEPLVLAGFRPEWHCPEVELSPHWGMLDAVAAEAWLAQNLTSVNASTRDLLAYGRAGLRIGNLGVLANISKRYVSPATREVPLERGRLTTCPAALEKWPEDLARKFVDRLFPAAQGVESPGAVAYCTRYAIEVARLTVLGLADPSGVGTQQQREVAERWRVRCSAQLQVVRLCVGLGVYRPRTVPSARACPHFTVAGLGQGDYTTPECLVQVGGAFYDPCRCLTCAGAGTTVSPSDFARPECRLRFDPRDPSLLPPLQALGWYDGVPPAAPAPSPSFVGALLSDPTAVGNTVPGASWFEAEGWMANTSEFCDMVQDWWPDDWDFPVGYHVTVPCDADDTAYRTFAQAFADDRSGPAPRMAYQHDLLRDVSLADTHFGAGGLCRTTNFGMPMPVTNTMRYCTAVPLDGTEDFTTPSARAGLKGAAMAPMQCTASSAALPWPSAGMAQAPYDPALYSVGTVPNMPPPDASTYPATLDDMWDVGPWQEFTAQGSTWGGACSDYPLYLCATDADCADRSCRGRVCSNDQARACTADANCTGAGVCRGVCMDPQTDCIRHSDCPPDLMCSGVGTCEVPTLVLSNGLTLNNVSFQLATQGSCPPGSRAFTLEGGSYWAYTSSDLLRAHGMCSFEDWFKYTQATMARCAVRQADTYFEINPTTCPIVSLDRTGLDNATVWWSPTRDRPDFMYLRPTNCDRDYERLEGFTLCAPESAVLVQSAGGAQTTEALDYDQYVRLHESRASMYLARMPEAGNLNLGFLGLQRNFTSLDELESTGATASGDHSFVSCGTLSQCYPADFYSHGALATRNLSSGSQYPQGDVFSCGAFGYVSGGRCVIDEQAMVLYQALCAEVDPVQSCVDLIGAGVENLCLAITSPYDAQNHQRTANLQALTELFYSFPSFTDFDGYLRVTTCMSDLYSRLGGRSLYFPFMYSLYEFPFDWFYQCMVMMPGVRVDVTSRGNQDCAQFRQPMPVGGYTPQGHLSDSWVTFVRRVRGGYLKEDVEAFASTQGKNYAAVIDAAKNITQGFYYTSGKDESSQTCSENLLWDISKWGDVLRPTTVYDSSWRDLIYNFYDSEVCGAEWTAELLAKGDQQLVPRGVTGNAWIQYLTLPDPDHISNPPGMSVTLLEAVREYMLVQVIPTQKGLTSSDQGCVTMASDMPQNATGSGIFQAYPFLAIMPDSPGQPTSMSSPVDMTCVYMVEDDPAFASWTGAPCQRVTITPSPGNSIYAIQCPTSDGTRQCTLVPMPYQYDGYYNCQYRTSKNYDPGYTPTDHEGVLELMYARMRASYYQARPVQAATLAPTTLPWFRRAWPFQGFDLTKTLDHQDNIQPNPNLAVMCTINADPAHAINFMACQSEHYQALKAHVLGRYMRDGAVIVPAMTQLEWGVARTTLLQGAVLSYANQNRTSAQLYVGGLFDDASVCTSPVMTQRVCWRNSSGVFSPVNPWLLGDFNPYSMCDVMFSEQSQAFTETVYSFCSEDGGQPNSYCKAFNQLLIPSQCKPLSGTVVPQPGVPPLAASSSTGGAYTYPEYNLCKHTLHEDASGCTQDQGLLGGFDGLPVAAPPSAYNMLQDTPYAGAPYAVAPNLYTTSAWGIPSDFQGGVFAGTNPLWGGQSGPFGYLQASDDELGGHRVGLSLTRTAASDTISLLLVDRLPLSAGGEGVPLNLSGSMPVGEWVPTLQADMAADDQANQRLYRIVYTNQNLTGASCPLQRWAFYSGGYSAFSPTIPSPQRSKHLFYRIHKGRLAHPTMRQSTSGANLGVYRTSNGFCACPQVPDVRQPQCLAPVGATTNDCSLLATVQALAGLRASVPSTVFAPLDSFARERQCSMYLDWPNVNGTLRDGAAHAGSWAGASSVASRQCHVLDRFQPFLYNYTSAQTMDSSGLNTVSAGVCQTRRAVRLNPAALVGAGRCVRSALLKDTAHFTCSAGAGQPNMPRPVPLTPAQTAQRRAVRRQRCSACAPPPTFTTQAGAPIPPESSFGRLFRPSAERMLAKDLRDALCGANGACPPFNASAWRRGRFMRNYLQSPASLFVWPDQPPSPPAPTAPPAPEPASVWEGRPWVFCPDTGSLRTGAGCKGTIPRAAWLQDRGGTCSSMIRALSASGNATGDPMARAPFCNIDTSTSAVCSAITRARALVAQANCIASGDDACMPSPFTYHPASYDASNSEWVHNTVMDFYEQLAPNACNTSLQNPALLYAQTRAYQDTCPANAVSLMVVVLNVLRTVITDVALLVTTGITMLFKMLAMVSGDTHQVANMRASAGADWAMIKKKGGAMLATAGDMLLDGMLNSGAVGKRLLQFLDKACLHINKYINWFLYVWCDYVKQYMLGLLAALQHLVGYLGTSSEILNDLMDYLFQGLLPAEFAEKYGNKMFQTLMEERYSSPTAHKDQVAAENHVSLGADGRPVSKDAATRNAVVGAGAGAAGRDAEQMALNTGEHSIKAEAAASGRIARALAAVSRVTSWLGPVGEAVGLGMAVYSGVNEIIQAKNDANSFYPDNFTLFRLDDIVNVITDMMQYLQNDQTCYQYQAFQNANFTYSFFPCFVLNMSQYASTSAGTTSVAATPCWADAQPSLGQSSLLSCSPSSTCCRTSECTDLILCATCPAAQPGTNQFGCSALEQKCVCGQAIEITSTCSSNGQCDAASQCQLAASLDGAPGGYGTIPCGSCPSLDQVMCMLPQGGLPGVCSCTLASSLQYALCTGGTGEPTIVDTSKMCGYVPGFAGRASDWSFSMDDIMLAPCAQAVAGVCAMVTPVAAPAMYMVMATAVRVPGARRRLLSLEEPDPPPAEAGDEYDALDPEALEEILGWPGWGETAAPCRLLVLAHQAGRALGVLDEYELRRCAYWRLVGHVLVLQHNLTALEASDTFLVSWSDLAQAALEPGGARALLRAGPGLLRAALYHPWARPLRALGLVALRALEDVRWRLALGKHRHASRPVDEPAPQEEAGTRETSIPNARGSGRRLLQAAQSVQADIQGVVAYSAQIITGDPTPSYAGQAAWSSAAFVWPPTFNLSLSACPAGLAVLRLGRQVALIDKLYYQSFMNAPKRPIQRSLRATLPDLSGLGFNASLGPGRPGQGWVSAGFHALMGAFSITPQGLEGFFTSERPDGLRWLLNTAVQCDLASVNTCSRHKRDLIMSVVVFGLLYALLSAVGGALGFPMAGTLLLVSFPSFILWYTYGVAITCFPLLPTCLLADVVAALESFAPPRVDLPRLLVLPKGAGLAPCEQLNFTAWYDPLAFALCDTDLPTCAWMGNWTSGVAWLDGALAPFAGALARNEALMGAPGYEPHAYRVCTWVSFVWVVPAVGATLLGSALAYSLASAALALLPSIVEFAGQLVVFMNSPG